MQLILQKQFREIVEDELGRRHWSRSDLARAMNCSRQMVTDYLNGKREPGPDTMEKFLSALELEPKLSVVRRKATALAG